MTGVRLGAADWRHSEWCGTFYPEDLPEDWQLAFFNTQYGCVWLDHDLWRGLAQDELEAWLADTREDFVFLLEAPADEKCTELQAKWPNRVYLLSREDPSLIWFEKDVALNELAASLAGMDRPPFLISRDGHPGTLEQVATLLELLGA